MMRKDNFVFIHIGSCFCNSDILLISIEINFSPLTVNKKIIPVSSFLEILIFKNIYIYVKNTIKQDKINTDTCITFRNTSYQMIL